MNKTVVDEIMEHVKEFSKVRYTSTFTPEQMVDKAFAIYQCEQDLRAFIQGAIALADPQWQPIETAPKTGKTLLLGYKNLCNRWRTMRGQWMSADYIEQNWEDDPEDASEGWYETSVEADSAPSCWYISPMHWMPLPSPPKD